MSISDTTPGAIIYYTTDGTTPTTSSTVYGGSITLSSTETLEAIATGSGYFASAVATAAYTIAVAPTLESIAISPTNATILVGQTQQFTATGTYSDSSTQDLTSTVAWASSNMPGVTINSSGLATALGIGASTITASLNGVTSNSANLIAIEMSFTAPTEPVGTASGPQTATILLSSSFTLGSISVVTQGAPNLDFNLAPGGTCTVGTAYAAGQTCTVKFTFTPTAPGQRMGAIVIVDVSGNLQATEYISGMGTGPQVSFLPGSQTTIGGGFNNPKAVAVDGSRNIFVADNANNSVKEILAIGGYTTVRTLHSGFSSQFTLALDGSGNVFVADWLKNAVYEILAAGGYSTINTLGISVAGPNFIAVDGSGNLFITWDEYGHSGVIEALAASGYKTVNTLGGFDYPSGGVQGVAVDEMGNVFVARDTVYEILSAGGYTTVKTLGDGFNYYPLGIALDGNGNVFFADSSYHMLREFPAAGGYTTVKTFGIDFNSPMGVTVDDVGTIFVADYGKNQVVKLDTEDAPSLSFASTAVGSTSSDSPQTVTLLNNGNTALTFSIPSNGNNPSISTNFTLNSSGGTACPFVGSTASSAGTLASGHPHPAD